MWGTAGGPGRVQGDSAQISAWARVEREPEPLEADLAQSFLLLQPSTQQGGSVRG